MLSFKDFKEKQKERTLPLREKYFRGLVFPIGAVVEDSQGLYEILDRGTNYVTVVGESGGLSKKFIQDLTILEDANIPAHVEQAEFSFKGYLPSGVFLHNEQAVAAFQDTAEKYKSGEITDAVAILKALHAVDKFLQIIHAISVEMDHPDHQKINAQAQEQLNIASKSLVRIGEYMHHQEYLHAMVDTVPVAEITPSSNSISENMDKIKSTDKLKIAAVIADTLGADSSGSNAETMVNNALRKIRSNTKLVKGEAAKIVLRMLELARQVGIEYDVKILDGILKEDLNELSIDTIKSYQKKVKQTPVPDNYKKGNARFMGGIRAGDREHSHELKRISKNFQAGLHPSVRTESYKPGSPVSVSHESGKVSYGKVKGVHGSVIEVSHRNGKVGFYPA